LGRGRRKIKIKFDRIWRGSMKPEFNNPSFLDSPKKECFLICNNFSSFYSCVEFFSFDFWLVGGDDDNIQINLMQIE
jgi:hypothetical protein